MAELFVIGIDLSLNHCGMVGLSKSGDLNWWRYVTDKPTYNKSDPTHSVLLRQPKMEDRTAKQIRRLVWWEDLFDTLPTAEFVGIEDYAQVRGTSNSDYQIGELGAVARLWALRTGAQLRLHEPMSVKMHTALTGAAKPEDTRDAVFSRWPETNRAWLNLPNDPSLDLCAAYGVARMVLCETQLRSGKLRLDQLHPKEVQVYNRITKANPVNLLAREFITR